MQQQPFEQICYAHMVKEELKKILGSVVDGDTYGRKLGFPTANILAEKPLKFDHGIYAGIARLGARAFKAAIVISPSLKADAPKIEAHLLRFNGDLYGKELTLELIAYIRPWRLFASENALREQIKKDIERVDSLIRSMQV